MITTLCGVRLSNYQNKKYMKFLATTFIAGALALSFSCSEGTLDTAACGVPATVRDLSQLDACGWVFELNDGTRIEPFWPFFCGTPPLPKEMTESPLYNFEYVDGKTVYISYELMPEMTSACMAGSVAKITCISERMVDTGEE